MWPYCYKWVINFSSSGNDTAGSRSYSDFVDTWTYSLCIHQLVLKTHSQAVRIMYKAICVTTGEVNSRGQKEDKRLIQHSQLRHRGELWHIESVHYSAHHCVDRTYAFPESHAADKSYIRSLSNWDNRKRKGLEPPPSRWVSAKLLHVRVSVWQWSWQCGQKLHKFSCEQWGFFNYIILHGLNVKSSWRCIKRCFSPFADIFRPNFCLIFRLNFCAKSPYPPIFSRALASAFQETSFAFRCHQSRSSNLQRQTSPGWPFSICLSLAGRIPSCTPSGNQCSNVSCLCDMLW